MKAKTYACALIAILLLAACGNKGPLVLPEKPAPATQDAPAPSGDLDDEDGRQGGGDG